ncbi:MAG: SEC-C domain-containing protein [Rhodoferax sp.]|nr:SEC-C domain-containing protein [Rhodoferax sp.]
MMPIQKIDPYQPCPCGSGRKYKFCCRAKEVAVSQESPRSLIRKSTEYPVSQCVIGKGWQENGLATIFVVRQLPNQKYIFGSYLVDVLCLGLKDTFCNANMPASAVQSMLARANMEFEMIEYEDARSLILGGIEYARNLGFEPNPDWKDSQYVIESARPFVPKYAFGRNGQPFYIQGPHDNVSQIMSKLSKFKSDFMIVKEPHHE